MTSPRPLSSGELSTGVDGKSTYSRRAFLGTGGLALLGGAVSFSALLEACGSSSKAATASSVTSATSSASSASSVATTAAPAEHLTSLSIQLEWLKNVQWAGSWVASSRGYYAANGVKPTFVAGGPSTTVQPLVTSGTADIGITDVLGTAQARSQGAPLVIVAATYQKNPNGVASRAANPIKTPADLIGKKVGVPADGISTYKTFMQINHLDPNKATVVPIQTDPSPLGSGEIDALLCYITNQAVTLETRGIKLDTFLLADFGFPLYDDVYVVTEATLKDATKRQAIVNFLKAEQQGWQAAVADAQLGASLAVNEYGKSLQLELAQQVLEAQAQNPLVQPAGYAAADILKLSAAGVSRNLSTLKAASITADSSLFDSTLL
jgi:ABC-type nitrate/sulfonate/bicarbonate transport system substrate-binding protein